MKKLFIMFRLIVLSLLILSCKKEYEYPGSLGTNLYCVVPITTTQIHETIYFGDLSSGVVSRTWTFPSKYVDIKGSDNDRTSENSKVGASFSKPGKYQVNLKVKFDKSLIDNDRLNGATSVDTTFTVTVTDYVKAWFRVNYVAADGSDSTSLDTTGVNQVMGGEYIRYTSKTYGAPSNYFWHFEGGNPEFYEGTDSTVLVQYPSLGNFGVYHIAYRNDPDSYDTISYSDFIEVVPSTRPAKCVGATKVDNLTVELVFSQNVSDPSDQLDNFSIDVWNSGDEIPIEITALESHATLGNKIIVRLSDNIYDDDLVSINYTPGDFENAYGGVVAPIDSISVEFILESALPEGFNGGFENPSLPWVDAGWDPPYTVGDYISERETGIVHSGSASMKITLLAGYHNMAMLPPEGAQIIPSINGQAYQVSFWYYSPEQNGGADGNANIGTWEPFGLQFGVSLWGARNEWRKFSVNVTGNGSDQSFVLRGIGHTVLEDYGDVVFYLDDIRIDYIEVRPE